MHGNASSFGPLVPCTLVGLAIGYFLPMGFDWWYVDYLRQIVHWTIGGALIGLRWDLSFYRTGALKRKVTPPPEER
jgi:hypothetical protein